MQVNIAPYDVRQGNFVGASVNTVTRSGTNSLRGSTYHRFRNDGFVGTEARGNVFNPGTFDTQQTGGWAGGADRQEQVVRRSATSKTRSDARPLYTFRANNGGEPVGGNVTRVLASDCDEPERVPEEQLRLRHRLVRPGRPTTRRRSAASSTGDST